MVPKSKTQLSKFNQNVYGTASQKLELYLIKSVKKKKKKEKKRKKRKPNEKLSINCDHIGDGSYMFISTS